MTAPTYTPLAANATPTLGTSGAAVSALQTQLNTQNAGQAGYTPLIPDGKYGPLTQAASQYKAPVATVTPDTTKPNPNIGFTSRMDYSTNANGVSIPVDPKTGLDIPQGNSSNPVSATNPRPLYGDETAPALVTAKTADQIQQEKLTAAQGEIDNLNKYYDSLKNEQQITNASNSRSTDSVSTLTGLAGSSEAGVAAKATNASNDAALGKVEQQRQAAVNTILSGIRSSAVTEAQQSRTEARQSEQDRLAYREKAQTDAVAHLASLSKANSGATLEGLKATLSPEEYNYLITNAGGEANAKAVLFENRPKDSLVGTPYLAGDKVVQAYTTPDGKVIYEDTHAPQEVIDAMKNDPKNIAIEKGSDGVLRFMNKQTRTWTTVTGSGKSTDGGTTNGTGTSNTIAGDVKDILEGRNTMYNIKQTMGRTNSAAAYMQSVRNQIRKVDPSFDFIASDAGGKSVSTSYVQKSTAAINSVLPNIGKVIDLSNQVQRIGVSGVDALLQKGAIQIGNQKVSNFHEAQKLIADEIGTALGSGSMSDMKLQLGFDITDPSVRPDVFASNMGIVKEFIENRKQGLNDLRYKSSTAGQGGSTEGGSTFQGITLPH